jgi:hypothetical protein
MPVLRLRSVCELSPKQLASYLIGGVVVVSLLSWIFFGWPSDADGWGGRLFTGMARLDAKSRQSC